MKKIYVIIALLFMNIMTLNGCIRYNHQTNMYYSTKANEEVNDIEYDALSRIVLRTIEASLMEGVSIPRTIHQVISALRVNGKPAALQLANDLFLLMV